MRPIEAVGLTKRFGDFSAVKRLDLAVDDGEIRAIIGPNGAGKSTLFNLLAGSLRPSEGEISLFGKDVTRSRASQIAHLGVARTFQLGGLFAQLTVRESVTCGLLAQASGITSLLRHPGRVATKADAILEELALTHLAARPSSTLSHGDQRALGIGIALAAQPRLLLLDEPTAGMGTEETDSAMSLIKSLARERGLTIVIVEHDVDAIFALADSVTVMASGSVLRQGSPSEIRTDDQVINAYLGTDR